MDEAGAVEKVAANAGNLRGTHVGILNRAADTIAAVMRAMSARESHSDSAANEEIGRLRTRLSALEEENRALKRDIEKKRIPQKAVSPTLVRMEQTPVPPPVETGKRGALPRKERPPLQAPLRHLEESGAEVPPTNMEVDPPVDKTESLPQKKGKNRGKKASEPATENRLWTEACALDEELTIRINNFLEMRARFRKEIGGGLGLAPLVKPAKLANPASSRPASSSSKPTFKPPTREAKAPPKDANKPPAQKPTAKKNRASLLPSPSAPPESTWAEMAKRNKRKGAPAKPAVTPPVQKIGPTAPKQGVKQPAKGGKKPVTKLQAAVKRKLPTTAAVILTCPAGKYTEAMREAKDKISLNDLGIEGLRAKRALTGALTLEISGGTGGAEKADALAGKLRTVFEGREGYRVSKSGGCSPIDVKVGTIKTDPNGMGTAWVRCPLAAANKIAAAGARIFVGWVRARMDILEQRPLQCFKCLEGGHVRSRCPNSTDRSDLCYRCGAPGHLARDCTQTKVRCPLCEDLGRPSNHRVGSKACPPSRKKKGVRPVQPVPAEAKSVGGQKSQAPPTEKETATAAATREPAARATKRRRVLLLPTTSASSSDAERSSAPKGQENKRKRRKNEETHLSTTEKFSGLEKGAIAE